MTDVQIETDAQGPLPGLERPQDGISLSQPPRSRLLWTGWKQGWSLLDSMFRLDTAAASRIATTTGGHQGHHKAAKAHRAIRVCIPTHYRRAIMVHTGRSTPVDAIPPSAEKRPSSSKLILTNAVSSKPITIRFLTGDDDDQHRSRRMRCEQRQAGRLSRAGQAKDSNMSPHHTPPHRAGRCFLWTFQ